MAASTAAVASKASESNRWIILFFSILSMVAVANFQYGWTLFVPPLQKHLNTEQALIQVTFTTFVLLETWLVPFGDALGRGVAFSVASLRMHTLASARSFIYQFSQHLPPSER